jgi:hypothetical protein
MIEISNTVVTGVFGLVSIVLSALLLRRNSNDDTPSRVSRIETSVSQIHGVLTMVLQRLSFLESTVNRERNHDNGHPRT